MISEVFYKKRKKSKIQILRALAIIAVVMIYTYPNGITQVYVRLLINFPVVTFLFLSGYLTDLSENKIKDFYKKELLDLLFHILFGVFYIQQQVSYLMVLI